MFRCPSCDYIAESEGQCPDCNVDLVEESPESEEEPEESSKGIGN